MPSTSECTHPQRTKVIDKLGPMLDVDHVHVYRGKTIITPGAQARVLAWHWVCRDCGTTIPREESKDD